VNKIRIISGIYKNRFLQSPEGLAVRPTSGRVKESLFNILQFNITDCKMLDLFSGCGQIGLEALSRGASSVTFADLDITLTQSNITHLGCGKEAEVIRGEYTTVLSRLAGMGRKYEIIFADPPYEAGYYDNIMKAASALLFEDSVLILEHNSYTKIIPPFNLKVIDTRQYGSRSLTFLKEEQNETVDIPREL